MNYKHLAKHFPEIAALSTAEQETLLRQAYQKTFSNEHRLTLWRTNLISALIMTGLCFVFVLVIRPAVGMSQQTSALLLMLIGIPGYFVFQQRRFIKQLRINLHKLLP
jgi:hypothetical protein